MNPIVTIFFGGLMIAVAIGIWSIYSPVVTYYYASIGSPQVGNFVTNAAAPNPLALIVIIIGIFLIGYSVLDVFSKKVSDFE